MNLQEELKVLKERIAELEYHSKEQQEFPQVGDIYWLIDDEGSVLSTFYDNHYIDRHHQLIGNIFRTRDQAEFAVEKLKVEAELRKHGRPFKGDNHNFCIELCSPYKSISVYSYGQFQMQGTIYFESKDEAYQAIETIGEERIKKYIFGVEDL